MRYRVVVTREKQGMSEERHAIENALATSRGKVSGENGAAKELGLPASTVEFRIRKLGIDKFRYRKRWGISSESLPKRQSILLGKPHLCQ